MKEHRAAGKAEDKSAEDGDPRHRRLHAKSCGISSKKWRVGWAARGDFGLSRQRFGHFGLSEKSERLTQEFLFCLANNSAQLACCQMAASHGFEPIERCGCASARCHHSGDLALLELPFRAARPSYHPDQSTGSTPKVSKGEKRA